MALLSFVAASSITFALPSISWFGLALVLISVTAIAGVVEIAHRQAPRIIEGIGAVIGALAGLATASAVFWFASAK